jgi:hypothetical protein
MDAAIPRGNLPIGVQTTSPMLQITTKEDSSGSTVHSGLEGQVGSEVHEKFVAHVSTVNDDTT